MDVKCQFHPPHMGGCPDYEPKTMKIKMENNDNFERILEMNTEAERRRIAAMAMQGFIANGYYRNYNSHDIASFAVVCADALIAELNKKKNE